MTLFVLEVARIILAEATMSFLGYGIQPPASSWGLMIGEGRKYFPMAWCEDFMHEQETCPLSTARGGEADVACAGQ